MHDNEQRGLLSAFDESIESTGPICTLPARYAPQAGIPDLAHQLEAQESERRRMSSELHDLTGQLFLELNMELARLRAQPGLDQAAPVLDEIEATVGHIGQEIRSFAFIHYPAELGDRGLDDALGMLCRGFGRRTGLAVAFHGACSRQVSRSTGLAFLRIAQEALTNIHRHAKAAKVRVSLTEQHGRLVLAVTDDGIGIDCDFRASFEGVGMRGMAHRVEQLGGSFDARRLKHGTKVTASLPYERLAA
jgi:signal transduction histidine kinase